MSRAVKCDGCQHIFELSGEVTSEKRIRRFVERHKCSEYKPGEVTVINQDEAKVGK